MDVASIMTPCPHKVQNDTTLERVKEVMNLNGIRHLPVVDGEKLVGLITKRDVDVASQVSKEMSYSTTAGEICALEPFIVSENESLSSVAKSMAEKRLDCVLVKDSSDNFSGIVTTVDVCRVLHLVLEERKN